jgi:hypothetical protein
MTPWREVLKTTVIITLGAIFCSGRNPRLGFLFFRKTH